MKNLDKIKHVVVLMLENRSFDSMFGYLYESDAPLRFIGDGAATFDGVAGREETLVNVGPRGDIVHVAKAPHETQLDMCSPYPDPGEEFTPHINIQLYGTENPTPAQLAAPPPMSGFVIDYEREIRSAAIGNKTVTPDEYRLVMNCFTPEAAPVVSGLARAYAISDRWFASVPSQTFCNRSFLHSAQSNGFVHNDPLTKWAANDAKTIFHLLEDASVPWRIYFDATDLVPATLGLHRSLLPHLSTDRARHFDRFAADCASGDLPAYTFIEPRLFINHNDQHPPAALHPQVDSSVLAGELLVNEVYEAICQNAETRNDTLLVVLWDEHGGLYDHVPPPVGAAPPPPKPGDVPFAFDRFGVRVGAIFVSPWIDEKTIVRAAGATPFDHTAIIKTVCERWSLPSLTARDAAAPSLEPLLTRATPRSDVPKFTPRPYSPTPVPFARSLPLTDHQRNIVGLISSALLVTVPAEVRDVGEALDHFARSLKI